MLSPVAYEAISTVAFSLEQVAKFPRVVSSAGKTWFPILIPQMHVLVNTQSRLR